MDFTSGTALFLISLFFVTQLLIVFFIKNVEAQWEMRKKLIAIFSLVLYASWYPPGLFLLTFFIGLLWAYKYLFGVQLQEKPDFKEKIYVTLAIISSLAVLFVFKYYNFFVQSFGIKSAG